MIRHIIYVFDIRVFLCIIHARDDWSRMSYAEDKGYSLAKHQTSISGNHRFNLDNNVFVGLRHQ